MLGDCVWSIDQLELIINLLFLISIFLFSKIESAMEFVPCFSGQVDLILFLGGGGRWFLVFFLVLLWVLKLLLINLCLLSFLGCWFLDHVAFVSVLIWIVVAFSSLASLVRWWNLNLKGMTIQIKWFFFYTKFN